MFPIPELPYPFICDGKYMLKDCVHGKEYQNWENKPVKKKQQQNLVCLFKYLFYFVSHLT